MLQAYTLAQEGISRPKVLNNSQGGKVEILKWIKPIISRLAHKVKNGTKFFVKHEQGTNSHDGRKKVGEVLASFVKNIKGKLSNVIIGYFPDEETVKNADVCSVEAKVDTNKENYVVDVNDVSGIALGNSNVDIPGFSGALRLNTIQCFEEEQSTLGEGEKDMGEKREITFDDIKQAVKDKHIWPHELYDENVIKNDKVFGKTYEENAALKADNERLKKEYETLSTTNKEAIRKMQNASAKDQLAEALKEGFTDMQKNYISSRFDPESFDEINDETISKFIEKGKADFARDAKLFGLKLEEQKPLNNNADGSKNTDDSQLQEDKTNADKALEKIGV